MTYRLPEKIIQQYQEMPIFKKISSNKMKDFDAVRLHNLARQLRKNNPQISTENILLNQLELYSSMQPILKKYFRSPKSDEDKRKRDQEINQKYSELALNPIIDNYYQIDFRAKEKEYAKDGPYDIWKNFVIDLMKGTKKANCNRLDMKYGEDFFDSVELLTEILAQHNNSKKSENNDEKTPTLEKETNMSPAPKNEPLNPNPAPKSPKQVITISQATSPQPRLNSLPIFKDITAEEADLLEKLAQDILRQHPDITTETLLITQIFALSDIRKENKKFNQKLSDDKTTSAAIEQILTRNAKNPMTAGLDVSIDILYEWRRHFDTPATSKNPDTQNYNDLVMTWIKSLPTPLEDITTPLDGWIRSQHPDYAKDKNANPIYRFICNVDIHDQKLLDDINDFTIKYHCQNKIPSTLDTLNNRADTLLIYAPISDKKQISAMAAELHEIIKPYVRSQGDTKLDGKKMYDGLFIAGEKTRTDINKLIQTAQKNCSRTATHLQTILNDAPQKKHPLSLGQFLCYKDLIDSTDIYETILQRSPNRQQSQPIPNKTDKFKDSWRDFANKVATDLKGNMTEDTSAKEFKASITHAEGSLSIVAPSANEITLGAKNSSGQDTVPDLKVFQELAQKAKNEDSDINFGNIKTPEFKARLLIACLDKDVKTNGAPDIKELLNDPQISEESKKILPIVLNKQQKRKNTPNATTSPTNTPVVQAAVNHRLNVYR